MFRKFLTAVLALVLILGLVACGKEEQQGAVVVNGEEAALCPWDLDVVEAAKKDGRIHYYFMASHGLFMDAEANHPDKWGDSCLVVFPDGQTMLIDGGMEAYGPVLVANLKRMGIEKLDYVMMSHSHNDHCYGLLCKGGVLENFPVGKIFWTGIVCEYWKDMDLVARCEELGHTLEALKQGDVRTFGDVTMEVLWPEDGYIGTGLNDTTELNNKSLVVRFDYKGHASLFTGDLYEAAETEVVDSRGEKLDVDLLKVCHHGSPTSSSLQFLQAVSPKVAVATGYQEVTLKLTERFGSVGAKLVYDRMNGYIHVSSDGTQLEYETDQTRSKGESKIIPLN